jgi:site-specific DNA-methyltransferase (adenine-specific)
MNLDACRVDYQGETPNLGGRVNAKMGGEGYGFKVEGRPVEANTLGRFPPHLLHDGSDVVKKCFPDTGISKQSNRGLQHSGRHGGISDIGGNIKLNTDTIRGHNDNGGSASRFFPSLPYDEEDCATIFYCAKASRTDRGDFNNHVSVKPTNLMRWLCRLLTPKGGTLLDPFMGSGSTLKAAVLENFTCIGIEMDEDYFAIAEARVAHVSSEIYVTPSRPERAEVAPRQQRMF